MLTTAEWDRLQRLETLLKPCRYVTELLGGETFVSCSIVLPALSHLTHTIKVSDDDMAYVDLKCLPRGERGQVWTSIEALLRKDPDRAAPEPTEEPARKKSLLRFHSDSELEDEDEEGPNGALTRYRAESTISETDCPLQWWSTHEGAHPQLSSLTRK
uniref:Uncharacterized protein n=1 Tax=Knipowitschia caucasica TaxID=637954 RepID=A0AAV2M0Y7_KNICA